MQIIENRTGTTLNRPLRILSILRGQWDRQRAPALQALADLGHEVIYVDKILPIDGYRKLVERLDFDVAVLWGSSLQNFLMSSSEPFFLEELNLPYVSLWTDNPIKHLFLLKDVRTPLHRGMFVADSRVIDQLKELGFENIFYLPPWHIDPEIFKPVDAQPAYQCGVSFAATVNSYDAERSKWRNLWNYHMNAAADAVIEKCRESRDHVDVFDAIGEGQDVWSLSFSLISHAMYFEQKVLAREQLILALEDREVHIHGIGSATTDRQNIIMHEGHEWHDLSPLFCSSAVNLNLTPWPKSCHHRVFQTTASRALAVTDWREDSLSLYEPDREVIYFKSLEELPGIVDHYTAYPAEAAVIAEAGYRRFLAEHTAAHRMAELSKYLYELI
ncbi:MAG: hypothetical protein CMM74_08425 [Rhodospirillaceae bacterium]|nr:hypothetical protein [Rhodospirillaceae bacterium]